MVKTFQQYLPETNRTYSCVHCRAHLASHDELISKSFQGSQGRAYLFNSVWVHIFSQVEWNGWQMEECLFEKYWICRLPLPPLCLCSFFLSINVQILDTLFYYSNNFSRQGKCCMRASGRKSFAHRTPRSRRHLLWMLQDSSRVEIRKF